MFVECVSVCARVVMYEFCSSLLSEDKSLFNSRRLNLGCDHMSSVETRCLIDLFLCVVDVCRMQHGHVCFTNRGHGTDPNSSNAYMLIVRISDPFGKSICFALVNAWSCEEYTGYITIVCMYIFLLLLNTY